MERISVIAPVYNEKENIKRFIEKVEGALKKRFDSYEIILIDDGSTDGSREILDKEAERNGHVKVYHFTKNNGQTAALAAGFKVCTGELVVTMDSDLQTNPEDIYVLLAYINDYDMVNGRRATREDGIKKKISSMVGNGIRNLITGDDIQDTGCPLKLFKKEVGISFQQYVIRIRLEYAANLLSYSNESITVISEYVHFPSQSYFGRYFKDFYHITPKEYRDLYHISDKN